MPTIVSGELRVERCGPPVGDEVSRGDHDWWLDLRMTRLRLGSSRFEVRLRRPDRAERFDVLERFALSQNEATRQILVTHHQGTLKVSLEALGVHTIELFDGGSDQIAWSRAIEVV